MPYCNKCGTEIEANTQYCPKCGASQTGDYYQQAPPRNYDPYDSGSFGWFILGFFIPLVGLILFLVWSGDKPRSAKMAGMGALISILIGVIGIVLYIAFIGALLSSMSSSSTILALL